jgi:hypothetical protein
VINPSFVRLRFSRRFVLIRVGYLSSSEAYTNNWVSLERKIAWLSTGVFDFQKIGVNNDPHWLGASEIYFLLYNTTRGRTHLLAFFLSGRVKLIVTSERLNIYIKCWRNRRKPPTCRKSLINFITKCCTPRPDRDSNSQLQW